VLGREAVRLDWQLFGRSITESSGGAWVVLAAAVLALSTMGQSSYRLGVALRSHQLVGDQAQIAVGLQLWAAFAAALAFVLATGELNFMRRLLADLATRPVSRRQVFFALQTVATVGRHTLALLSVGLPLLILLDTWLDGVSLVAAIGATFVLMRLPVALLTIGSRVASASMATALSTGLAMLIVIAALWLTAPAVLTIWLPPFLVARILTDGPDFGAWAGLTMWTLMLAVVEFWTMGVEPAPVPSTTVVAQPHKPLPAAIRPVAQLFGCSPSLLHGELLRLSRWRRHQFSWLMCAFLMVMLGARLPNHPDLLRIVVFLLVPVHVGGSTLANLFAVDRAGFQAFLLGPLQMDAVIRAKVIAALLFTLVAEVAAIALLAARGIAWPPIAAGAALAAGLFAWTAAIGMITSALFPSASDPQTVGGSLVTTSAFAVIAVSGTVYIGAAIGLAYLFDSGRATAVVCALAGMSLVLSAVAALVAASRISPRLVMTRLEAMIAALTASTGART